MTVLCLVFLEGRTSLSLLSSLSLPSCLDLLVTSSSSSSFLSLVASLSFRQFDLAHPPSPQRVRNTSPLFSLPFPLFFRETQATILSHLPVPFPVCRSSNSNNHQPPGHTVCRHPTLAFVVISTSNYHTLLKVFILLLQSTLILYIAFSFYNRSFKPDVTSFHPLFLFQYPGKQAPWATNDVVNRNRNRIPPPIER